jgi:hypothetical protein
MLEIVFLGLLATAAIALACRKPVALFLILIVAGPYYGVTKLMLNPDSFLLAWKDVLLASLLIGIFLRLNGRLRCPVILTVLLIYCVVSAAIPGDWETGVLGFRATCQWMLLAVAASSLRDASLVRHAGRALIWSGTFAAIVYMIERLFYHNQDQIAASMGIRGEDQWRYNLVLERFSLIYGNPNSFAVFLILCACFAFAWYLNERAGRVRTLAMVCGGVCVAGVLFTASRGAIAALVVAVVLISRKGTKMFRRIVLVGALAGSVFVIQPELLTQRLQDTNSDKFFSSYRYEAWVATVERAVSSPQLLLVGSGLGTFGGYVSDMKGTSDIITENQFFKILGEQGVMGLLLMLGLIWRFRKSGVEAGSEGSIAVPAALAAVLTYAMLGNILDGLIVAVPFWIIAGVRISEPAVGKTQLAFLNHWNKPARAGSFIAAQTSPRM